MGKPTGFMESSVCPRRLSRRKPRSIIGIRRTSTTSRRACKARAAWMRHPFCNNGCPVKQHHPGLERPRLSRQVEGGDRGLHSTNNFPDFTGRSARRRCEAACTLNINNDDRSASSRSSTRSSTRAGRWLDRAAAAATKTGKKVAVVGSGPAGRRPQQLARVGHDVTVFEKTTGPAACSAWHPRLQARQVGDRTRASSRWKPKASPSATRHRRPCRSCRRHRLRRHRRTSSRPNKIQSEFDAVILATGSKCRATCRSRAVS